MTATIEHSTRFEPLGVSYRLEPAGSLRRTLRPRLDPEKAVESDDRTETGLLENESEAEAQAREERDRLVREENRRRQEAAQRAEAAAQQREEARRQAELRSVNPSRGTGSEDLVYHELPPWTLDGRVIRSSLSRDGTVRYTFEDGTTETYDRDRHGDVRRDTTSGAPHPIHFPPDLLRGAHHLYVARTRMGKSTLMQHLVVHKLQEKAAGRDGDAIVVVDPHADLVEDLLGHVPESLISQVRLVDLADGRGAPGINLLDTRVFTDRDRTADSVVRVAKGLWEQWGPRMQSILEHTVKTLHEANAHPDTTADEQHTILDGLRLLSDEGFRAAVLDRVSDPYLPPWWGRDFASWTRQYQADALAPVQTRLSYYASSKRARAILGQPRSTIDVRRTILDGGILFVSTAQGTAGRDVAALVGSSILNLVDAVIREQGALPPEQRRGALVVVDEMQAMPGVDYEAMLSELGKFGASFVLATQSLAKLSDLSPTMQETLLANVGCLAVFQVAGADARQLVWELGKERVSEEDIVSLPVHHAYVRATTGGERMPAFSMAVRKPEDGNPDTAHQIRADAAAYVTPAADLVERDARAREQAERYRERLAELRKDHNGAQPADGPTAAPGQPKQRRQRSRRDRSADDVRPETHGGERGG